MREHVRPVKADKFDTIILNPPHTAGKNVCIKMIEQALDFLNKGGSLQIVARHNKGGETLSGAYEKVFGEYAGHSQERRL